MTNDEFMQLYGHVEMVSIPVAFSKPVYIKASHYLCVKAHLLSVMPEMISEENMDIFGQRVIEYGHMMQIPPVQYKYLVKHILKNKEW